MAVTLITDITTKHKSILGDTGVSNFPNRKREILGLGLFFILLHGFRINKIELKK